MSSFVSTKPQNAMLLKQYATIRQYTEHLCKPLEIEDYIPQPVDFISPPKWHLAHTTWFFETFILRKYKENYQIYHEDFSFLFNSYYNAVGDRVMRATRGNLTRPGVKAIYAYRKYVDEQMSEFISNNVLTSALQNLIVLGLNHEQQHQELLITDLKYIFGHNPIWPVYRNDFSLVDQQNKASGFIKMEEGVYEIGFEGEGFHWDNELGRHKVYLQDFEVSETLVTNGEYIEFIEAGGYERFELWLDEGWSWVNNNLSSSQTAKVTSPLYWHKVNGEWKHYTLKGFNKINPGDILCHINFFEAAAFAEWKGMRLPTEFEWEAASDQLDWGQRWEWTNSAYLPYPNFAKAEGAIGEYNGKFMVNQKVLRGASTATSPNHSRKTYRNFFHTHLQWQCTGIRLCK